LICWKCCSDLKSDICPFCRHKHIKYRPSYIVRKIISSMLCPCPCKCEVSLPFSEIKNHIKEFHMEEAEKDTTLFEKLLTDFDIMIYEDKENFKKISPFHKHELIKFPVDSPWSCRLKNVFLDKCLQDDVSNKFRYRCPDCNINFCSKCLENENKFKNYKHEHYLQMVDEDNGWICNGKEILRGCKSGITDYFQTYGFNRFRCEECDFDLCEKCNAKGGVHDASHPLETVNARGWRHPRVPTGEGRKCPFKRNEASESKGLHAAFVQSVQTTDGTKVAPKAEFTKVWKVRNNGPSAWPENTVLSFVYGDRLEAPPAVQLSSAVAPGEELDVAVTMIAPSISGRFSNYWRLCSSDGTFFGPPLYTRIIVEESAPAATSIIEQPVPRSDIVPLVPEVVVAPVVVPEVVPEVVPAPVVPAPAPVVVAPVVPEPVVPAPVVPAPVVEVTAEDKAVASLRGMGFTGDLLTALRRNGGDIEATVNYLLG